MPAPQGARQTALLQPPGPPAPAPLADAEDRARFERLVRRLEPDAVGRPERLPAYLAAFRRELVGDPRMFAVEVRATAGPDGVVRLSGHVEFEEHRAALRAMLSLLGFRELDDRIELLPSEGLGLRRFALVTATHVFLHDRPTEPREAVDDCLLGWPVFLLEEASSGRFLCHGSQGYVGCIDGKCLRRVDGEELARYTSGPQVYLQADHREGELVLPIGARLKCVSREGQRVTVELPSGRTVALPTDKCAVHSGQPDPRLERVVQTAERFLGTPYVWGGKTTAGTDCSGLVQSSARAEGLLLARDASQQAYAGTLTATRWWRGGLRRGDLLYFLGANGRITHTAIYLGEDRYIESVRPVVHHASFNPADKDYSPKGAAAFCFAKRLLE